jgi:hypothetical protein
MREAIFASIFIAIRGFDAVVANRIEISLSGTSAMGVRHDLEES